MKQNYKVRADGFLAGTWRNEGDVIAMHPKQAEFFLPPYGDRLELVNDAPAPAPAAPVAVPRKRKA